MTDPNNSNRTELQIRQEFMELQHKLITNIRKGLELKEMVREQGDESHQEYIDDCMMLLMLQYRPLESKMPKLQKPNQ